MPIPLVDPRLPAHRDFFYQLLGTVTRPTAPFGLTALPPNHTPAEIREGRLRLTPALSDSLRSHAAALGVSPASLFHLAWALVLGHVSHSRDVVFGTVLLGRMNSGANAAQVVGMFINTLPIRVTLDTEGTAASALATHRLLQQLLLHEHAPLAIVQRASGIPAPLPLITSLFNFRHSPEAPNNSPWSGVSMLFAEERTNYPVAMAVDDTGGDFLLTATTATAIDPNLLCTLLDRTVSGLLNQLATAPEAPLTHLPALPPIAPPLPAEATLIPSAPAPFEAPRTVIEATLQQIWQRILDLPALGIHDDFFYSGGESLTAMRLLSAVNTTLGVELPMRVLLDAPTVAGMAASLAASPATHPHDNSGGLVRLQPHGARPPLFCIHPAGGYVFCYLPLARALGGDQPLFGVQAQGLEEDEPLPQSIEEAASRGLLVLRKHQPQGPYQLLGMSSGGLIAFEIARQLQLANETVNLLAMLDTAVPAPTREALTPETLLPAMAAELGCLDLLETVDAPKTLAGLVARGQAAQRLPEGFTLSRAERIAHVFANTAAIHNRYQPVPTMAPVLLVRALRRLEPGDRVPDWTELISSTSRVVDLDCGHADLVSREQAPMLAGLLKEHLAVAIAE